MNERTNERTAERTRSTRDQDKMDKGRWEGGEGMNSAVQWRADFGQMSNEGEGEEAEEAEEEVATLQKQGRRRSGAALHARLLLTDCASAGSPGRMAISPLIPHHLLISATCQQLT